jgi:putative flavoprotein involved in K+ transport
MDVANSHSTWLAGKESGHIPYRIEGFLGRHLFVRLFRFVGHRVLSVATPVGRKARSKMLHRAAPLIRVKPTDLLDAGVHRVPRVTGVNAGRPRLADGQVLDVANVIWCTGFHPAFSWINLAIFDSAGDPQHERGIVTSVPGLYFLGLQFLSSMTSSTVTGVGRDAAYIAEEIESRATTRQTEDAPQVLSVRVA